MPNRGSRMIFVMNWRLSAPKYCRNALLGWAEFLGHADDRRIQDLRRCKLAGDPKQWSRRSDWFPHFVGGGIGLAQLGAGAQDTSDD